MQYAKRSQRDIQKERKGGVDMKGHCCPLTMGGTAFLVKIQVYNLKRIASRGQSFLFIYLPSLADLRVKMMAYLSYTVMEKVMVCYLVAAYPLFGGRLFLFSHIPFTNYNLYCNSFADSKPGRRQITFDLYNNVFYEGTGRFTGKQNGSKGIEREVECQSFD